MELDTILQIRQTFAEAAAPYRKESRGGSNAFGAFISQEGDYCKVGAWACHGWLQDYYFVDNEAWPDHPKYILSAVMKYQISKKQMLEFIDWMVNRSPWCRIFVDKDPESILKLGYLVDAAHPANFIANAMMATRFFTESYYPDDVVRRTQSYFALLDIGCTENEAFFFAHLYAGSGTSKIWPIKFSRRSSGHSVFFSGYYNKQYVLNFLNGTPDYLQKCKVSDGRGYESNSINKVWGPYLGNKEDKFGEFLRHLKPISGTEKENLNIFFVKKETEYSYNNPDDFKSVIDQLREYLYA